MQIIFLDFDGVLNSVQEVYYHRKQRNMLKEGKLGRVLWRLLDLIPFWNKDKFRNWKGYYGFKWCSHHLNFCPIACNNVQFILDKCPDARIVISSVWRSWGMKYCKKILALNGIDPDKIIGLTPYVWGKRGVQIQKWLDDNLESDIKNFVIIDDDSDMVHLKPNLIQTDRYIGFTIRQALKIIEYFGCEEDNDNFLERELRKIRTNDYDYDYVKTLVGG